MRSASEDRHVIVIDFVMESKEDIVENGRFEGNIRREIGEVQQEANDDEHALETRGSCPRIISLEKAGTEEMKCYINKHVDDYFGAGRSRHWV